MTKDISKVEKEWYEPLLSLLNYCKRADYKGYDVGDGLEAWILRHTPLSKSKYVRFLFVQLTGHRISFINLRPLLGIKTYHNAKGISLFLNAYCNLYDLVNAGYDIPLSKQAILSEVRYLADLLISLGNRDYGGIGWGYPLLWQSLSFSFPANTPTAVASSFAVDALFHTYEVTKEPKYRDTALDCANFVVNSLRRTPTKDGGFYFSYAPMDGNNGVYNASLLAARILLQCNKYKPSPKNVELAKEAVNTVLRAQNNDGSWAYGILERQSWIDNFHTGYNLEALDAYQKLTGDNQYSENLEKGLAFMVNNHFDSNHIPKYFHNKQYPIDIHCCGEIFVVLNKLNAFKKNEKLADDVYSWTMANMRDSKRGYFYHQKRKHITNKASLMRWSNAFMANALSYYLKSKVSQQ